MRRHSPQLINASYHVLVLDGDAHPDVRCPGKGRSFFMKQGSSANWAAYKDIGSFPVALRVREYPGAIAA